MTTALEILAALGGVIAFPTAVWAIVRAGFRQANATRENTEALRSMTNAIDKLDRRVDDHDVAIAVLKDRLAAR
jgi:hypothetical protein